jgi:hypothetical protein
VGKGTTDARRRVIGKWLATLDGAERPGGHGGSFHRRSQPTTLDPFVVHKNRKAQGAPLRADEDSVEILRFSGAATKSGDHPRPTLFGGMRSPVNRGGCSDHFAIGLRVTEPD